MIGVKELNNVCDSYCFSLISKQHVKFSQRWICLDNCMYCHTETLIADQSTLTPARPVQAPGRISTPVPSLDSLVWLK